MKRLYYIILCAALAASCVGEREYTPADDQMVAISLGTTEPTATRALTEAQENDIDDVTILIFNAEGKLAHDPWLVEGSRLTKAVVYMPGGTYDFVVLANAKGAEGTEKLVVGFKKSDLTSQLVMAGFNDRSHIRMWGERKAIEVKERVDTKVWMYRMVARVDVKVTGTDAETGSFVLKEVTFCYLKDTGPLVPLDQNWNPRLNSGYGGPSRPTETLLDHWGEQNEKCTDGKTIVRCFYPCESSIPTEHVDGKPFLLINGTYKGTDGWWRVDFYDAAPQPGTGKGTYFHILRNNCYSFNISKVTALGYGTAIEARNATDSRLQFEVVKWDATENGVWFDGPHLMAVSPGQVNFDKESHSASSKEMLTIKTEKRTANFDAVGKVTSTESWINNISISYPINNEADVTKYRVAYNVDKNKTSSERTGYISVTIGRMTQQVKIVQAAGEVLPVIDVQKEPGDFRWNATGENTGGASMFNVVCNSGVHWKIDFDDWINITSQSGSSVNSGDTFAGSEGFTILGIHSYRYGRVGGVTLTSDEAEFAGGNDYIEVEQESFDMSGSR